MFRAMITTILVAAAVVSAAGCRQDPQRWQGGLKLLDVHAIAFTPQGKGLLMLGPRRGGEDQANLTAYYHLDIGSMTGRRLTYGQYSLGQALMSPFNDNVAIPVYLEAEPGGGLNRPGYEIRDLPTGRLVRRVTASDPGLFVPHAGEQPASRPDRRPAVADIWRRLIGVELSEPHRRKVEAFRPVWLTRHAGDDAGSGIRTEVVDGQTFYVLPSPDGRHELFLRFRAPGGDIATAADPDGEGFAYGFLHDRQIGQRHMLYTTTGTDEFFESVGSVMIGGPIWLARQPVKWFRGR